MKKAIFIFFAAVMAALAAKAQITADWKLHMPYDEWPRQVIETPNRVYFMSRTFEEAKKLAERSIPSHSLFYYDKKGDEIVSVNERANAGGNAVACISYNPAKGYLLVVYTDCNIDVMYDDGRVFNIPALKHSSVPGRKVANSITFDPDRNRAYVATSFGYVTVNDQKHEIAESRNYGENIQCIARVGKNILLCQDYGLFFAPADEQRFNIDDYKALNNQNPANYIAPLRYSDNFIAFKLGEGESKFTKYKFQDASGRFQSEEIGEDNNVICVQYRKDDAYTVCGNVQIYYFRGDVFDITSNRPNSDYSMPSTTFDGTEIWVNSSRKGLRSYKLDGKWNQILTRDFMRPNAPATYISSSMAYHPSYGMLAASNAADLAYSEINQLTPSNISALKNGLWKEYGFYYSGNSDLRNIFNYGSMAVDPVNPNHVYTRSIVGGLMRTDLSNPANVMVMANPNNTNAGRPGFVKVADDQEIWNILCNFSSPQFTSDGTMWTLYSNMDSGKMEIWYWPSADRLASTSAANYRPMKKLIIDGYETENNEVMIALKKNKNILAIGTNGDDLIFYDHRGTPENKNDDRMVVLSDLYDQDGGKVHFLGVNSLYEDPSSGMVWIMTQRGLFTINPQTAFEDPNRINRIKVARNDGTNLADYLLNEINVNSMSQDGEGRKWFSTSNGLVCTSADGRTILGEFTTDNSYLPDNAIFATAYNPDSNSMLVATGGGLVEMFPSGSGNNASAQDSGVRAYPNPVEPDFYGWVRIDNIPDGSLVKITDAKGGIVKELGPAEGGSVQWDVSGLNHTRVSTGVYYIMVSPGSGMEGSSSVSKILVLN